MSIFKSTFTPEVKTQLDVRQKAMVNRTPQNLQYLNSRNAWIRMSSSVNVNGTNELAKKYILQGGTLNDKALKAGLGDFNNAYSNKSQAGTSYQRGIRPMPGIVSLDVKSKSAYGSLREVTVNFQCWDIQQLEDLELLYMRPGYTMLIEWGWTPYLDNTGKYQPTFNDYYDIINKPVTNRTEIFKELFERSKRYGGNYDAMFGYIKNYSWTARMDGGYDCQATVISTGEIIESLKVNYVSPDLKANPNSSLLDKEVINKNRYTPLFPFYSKNILAGLWAETYSFIVDSQPKADQLKVTSGSIFNSNNILKLTDAPLGIEKDDNSLSSDGNQAYITLGLMIDIINKYVIPTDGSNKPLIELSLNESTITSTGKDLLCISHPLQVSVDPTICLIKSPYWSNGELISEAQKAAIKSEVIEDDANALAAYKLLTEYSFGKTSATVFSEAIHLLKTANSYYKLVKLLKDNKKLTLDATIKNVIDDFSSSYVKDLADVFISLGLKLEYSNKTTAGAASIILDTNSVVFPPTQPINDLSSILSNSPKAIANIKMLEKIPLDYFIPNNDELATIKNIYVNVNYLYKLSINQNLENQDKKEKSEINLYSYLKNVIRGIQASIGSINNFEIHVDPIDNKVARIIDVNYTGEKNINTYNSLFPLQVHNLESVVRSYSMQSQMFPEQGALIAIASQAKGGQMGMQNNTMIDFNRSITDRIIESKTTPGDTKLRSENITATKTSILNNNLAVIIEDFASFSVKVKTDTVPEANNTSPAQQGNAQQLYDNAKNSLRDLIVYFQSITTSTSKNRNIIPIKFSFEMDGLGGLVIGHMFRLPNNIIPRGYRGENGVGSQLGQAITSISHTISNNDWVTKIEALNIVMDDNPSGIAFSELDFTKIFTPEPLPTSKEEYDLLRAKKQFSSSTLENAQTLKNILISQKLASVQKGELMGPIEKDMVDIVPLLFRYIQGRAPGVTLTVTSANDTFHQEQSTSSNHTVGRAIDFTISPANNTNKAKVWAAILEYQKTFPLLRALDEYTHPSKNSTGGHYHISYNVITKGA